MPIYEYYCEKCDCRVERLQKIGDPIPECPTSKDTTSPECGLKKVMSRNSFRLKGQGWYIDGYTKYPWNKPQSDAE